MFSIYRHIRLAACVVIVTGALLSNIMLVLSGNVLMFLGYAWSLHKIEQLLEESIKENQKEDTDEPIQ